MTELTLDWSIHLTELLKPASFDGCVDTICIIVLKMSKTQEMLVVHAPLYILNVFLESNNGKNLLYSFYKNWVEEKGCQTTS